MPNGQTNNKPSIQPLASMEVNPFQILPETAVCMVKFPYEEPGNRANGDAVEMNAIEMSAPGKTKKKTVKEWKAEQDIISFAEFEKMIPDEAAAVAFMEEKRWGQTPRCPRCGTDAVYRVKSGRPSSHRCRPCRKYFNVRTNTVFRDTKLPLRTWLIAIYLMHSSRKGMSSLQLHKHLGCAYPSAWHLTHRIRKAMESRELPWLEGTIQVDETWVGGKFKSMHASKKKELGYDWMANKTMVMGFRTHDGKVVAFPVDGNDADTLLEHVLTHVKPGSTVWSDGAAAYQELKDYGYDHEWVNHTTHEYVRGMVTTNGIESFWALVKRGYDGTYHFMSWRHLRRYVNEFSFRLNAGPGNGEGTISLVLDGAEQRRLKWRVLIGREKATSLADA